MDPERTADAVRGADLQVCQLSRGPVLSELGRVVFPQACLDMARLGPAMLFSGLTPRDYYTIIFVLECPEPTRAFNFEVEYTAGYVGVWAPGGALDASTPSGYRNATLTLPAEKFRNALTMHFPQAPEQLLNSGAALRVSASVQAEFRQVANSVWKMIWDPRQPLASPTTLGQIERIVHAAFFSALRSGCEQLASAWPTRVAGRHRRLRQARDLIAARLDQPLYIEDLCQATGLAPRALENLFQDLLGLSPTTYLRHQRLHHVHRRLQQTPPAHGTVKRAALDAGFLHHGHFARDYRMLFGESPSATLGGQLAVPSENESLLR